MTTHLDETEAFIAARLRGTSDLPLFSEAGATDGRVRPKPRVTMPGPSTHARAEAKVKADRSLTGRRGKILAALRGHGPMTRLALCEVTGLAENSVNSATSALLKDRKVHLLPGLDSATGRSIVALTEEAP